MIHKSDVLSRRILTFPAVRPCDSVSLATLLASLITLAHRISDYRSRFFASNKRNARESSRLVGVLLLFLEEIRDRKLNIPVSTVLCLSELHLTFQKIQYLLEDCTRDGARLWMLMKSERVSNQFRFFVRSIATALDVFPLDSIDVSIDAKEMVGLVMRQARKEKFEVEVDDELALKEVHRVFQLFEKMIVQDFTDLRRVLEHIGIQRWSECNQEIKFLEAEIGFEWSNAAENRTVAILSSLMGFVSYCRCVMFDVVDGQARKNSDNLGRGEVLSCLNADDFRCPISLEFMVDPVTIATGHTYDRSSILKWFKEAGNLTCPKTGERLSNEELVPNLALRRLIKQYCSDNGISIAESGSRSRNAARTVLAGSAAAEGAMKMVAKFLIGRLANGTIEQKNKAAYEIRLFSKTSIFNRSCLAEAGTIPHLLILLSSTDALTQENAIASLLNLSKHSKSKTMVVENGGVLLILDVLKMGLRVEAKQHAAAVLFYLSSVEEYRKLIGEIPEAIPALVDLIKDGTNRAKKNALVTIYGLLMHHNNHWRVLAAGAVPLLIDLLKSSETEDVITDSLAVLSNLAGKPEGTIAILRRGGLNLVLEILSSSNSRAVKEYCVSLLLALCVNGGGDVVAVLVKKQSLIGSLYTLLTEGTPRASKKASSVIRILHEFHERSSSGLKTPCLPRERIVHGW